MNEGEAIKCQGGAMAWMSPCIQMETKTGGLGGMFKKALVGESLALNHYTATAAGEQLVIDSGYVAAMEATCRMDIQTMPINALAMSLYQYMPHPSK